MVVVANTKFRKSLAELQTAIQARVDCLVLAYGVNGARRIIIKTHNKLTDEHERAKCVAALNILKTL